MKEGKVVELFSPEAGKDVLTELAREGARKMLEVALSEEVRSFLNPAGPRAFFQVLYGKSAPSGD